MATQSTVVAANDLNAAEISKALNDILRKKSEQPVSWMVLYGMLAGIYIGFGAIAATAILAPGGLPGGVERLLAGSVFCVGLILVIIPGSELFTGNILMATGLINRKITLLRLTKSWFFVYLGNFLGAVLLAFAMFATDLFFADGGLSVTGRKAVDIANAKMALAFVPALVLGILCNMLVCLAVILALSSRTTTGKVFGIYFPITVFVLAGFEHSIANMYFISAGLLASGEFMSRFAGMIGHLIPVTIGNIAGGLLVIFLHPNRIKQIGKSISKSGHAPCDAAKETEA